MDVLVLSLVVLVLTLAEICVYSSHRETCCGDGGESTEGTHWSWSPYLNKTLEAHGLSLGGCTIKLTESMYV
jgi:hypothetical protein